MKNKDWEFSANVSEYCHDHVYLSGREAASERRTWAVIILTSATMVLEIVSGLIFGSMALLADGWHMGTHAVALGVTAAAYQASRRHADDHRYSFGTWKIEVLGGFASAVVLAVIAIYVAGESIWRLFQPHEIRYAEALVVACLGLGVNLLCALLLGAGRPHGSHPHTAAHGHHHSHDLNLRSAYAHVLTDAMTSVFAILALAGGTLFGWGFLDPAMGIVGACVVGLWSYALLRDTSRVLLDREMDHPVVEEIREAVESDGESRITDLHLIRVGRDRFACALSVVTRSGRDAAHFKSMLAEHEELVHVTAEVLPYRDLPNS